MNDVTIIIPFYNRNKTILRTLSSVSAQEGDYSVEIIIIDDASVESPRTITEKWFADVSGNKKPGFVTISDCKIIRLEENSGPSYARNRGIKESNGNFIAFLDSDDEWLDGSLKTRIEVLKQYPNNKWVFCNFENYRDDVCVESDFTNTRTLYKKLRWENEGIVKIPLNFFECQLVQPLTQISNLIVRREILTDEFFFDERLRVAEDWEFILRLSSVYPPVYLNKILVRRHIQSDGLVATREIWFEGNIRAGETVLMRYSLTKKQRQFIEDRIANDFYEWGYYLNSIGEYRKAREKLSESLKRKLGWKTLRQIAKTWLPLWRR